MFNSYFSSRYFSQKRYPQLYLDIKKYLPKRRHKEFVNSWIKNSILWGSLKRSFYERIYNCSLPAIINISPTMRCNLNCKGCYSSSYPVNNEMSIQQIKTILKQAKNLGIYFIGFLGGEPLLRKDLFEVIEKNKDVAFRFSTNGSVLDDSIIYGLKKNGNVVTFLSIEGFKDETDYWRGDGVFKSITETFQTLKQERILFGFSCLIHSKNMDVITSRDFIEFLSNSGAKFCLFFPYGPMGEHPQYEYVMSEEQIDTAYKKLGDLQKYYSMLLIKEGFLAPAKKKLFYLERGCRAGATIHITPDGKVEPCNGIQFYTGNVFVAGLKAIFQSNFMKDILTCSEENGSRCIGMFEPQKVWNIISRNNAQASNEKAFEQYSSYAEFHKQRTQREEFIEEQTI